MFTGTVVNGIDLDRVCVCCCAPPAHGLHTMRMYPRFVVMSSRCRALCNARLVIEKSLGAVPLLDFAEEREESFGFAEWDFHDHQRQDFEVFIFKMISIVTSELHRPPFE